MSTSELQQAALAVIFPIVTIPIISICFEQIVTAEETNNQNSSNSSNDTPSSITIMRTFPIVRITPFRWRGTRMGSVVMRPMRSQRRNGRRISALHENKVCSFSSRNHLIVLMRDSRDIGESVGFWKTARHFTQHLHEIGTPLQVAIALILCRALCISLSIIQQTQRIAHISV